MFATHVRSDRKPAASLRSSASALTLTVALALSAVPAWADGGNGSSAGAGQGGVDGAPASATGQNAANGATAGGGGGGVDLTTGNGAAGGSGGTASTFGSPNGAPGATGAAGQVISTSGTISTSVSGGTGAAGSNGVNGTVRGGGGGGGGVGVSATADTVVTGSGSVTGGNGGVPGSNSAAGGGGGGVGVFSSANVTVEAGGSVTGGTGGRGGSVGGGGGGAAAIVLTGGGTIQNSGNLLGGTGGRSIVAGGGDGGAGVLLLSGGTLINASGATIVGGTGGLAGSSGIAGDGGAGIKGANIAVINAGTISGGAVGAGGGTPTAGKAIEFTGGVNSLEIQAGSTITGNVVAFSTADTFKLGGDTSASFDVSQIGAGAKYDGFGFYEKTGNSTWTLTGTTTAVTPWTLSGGILQISSDNNLGAATGGLTFNGGTLQNTAAFASARNIVLGDDGGTFLTDANLALSGNIIGDGLLNKDGAGTLTLSGNNSYTAGTRILAGTLETVGGSAIGDQSSVFVLGGMLRILDDETVATLSSGLGVSGVVDLAGGDLKTSANFANVTASFYGNITGAGGFIKDGAYGQVLAGDSTYAGATQILDGTLYAVGAGRNSISDVSAVTIAAGATLSLVQPSPAFAGEESDDETIGSLSGVGNVNLGDKTLTLGGDNSSTTFSGVISGGGSLAKAGTGTFTLTGANTYSGGTTITAGTLVGNAASIRGKLSNAATVIFDQASDASFAGAIEGYNGADGAMIKQGAGELTLTGTSSLDWTIDQGGLVSAAERFGGDVSIGAGGSFTFDQTANASYAGALSGAGTFAKDGQGVLVLASDNSTFTGATSVSGGTLAAGGAKAFSSASQFSVASGATLDLAGTSQTLAGLTNAGAVRIAGGGVGHTLTVAGDYVGNGGTVVLNTALGGDGSPTDMLVISGNTSGTGTLQVANFGGSGGQTVGGIKIVDVGGVSNGSFSLNGNYIFEGDAAVVAGAYAYRLYQGGVSTPGDGDWYLRSELDKSLLFQAGAPVYEAYASVLQSFNQLGTLQQRLGNRSWTVEAQGADGISDDVKAEAGIGLWGRIEGTSGSYDPESSTTATTYDTSTWRLQTGADMLVSDSAAGQLIGGVAFQYGTVSADVSSVFGSGSIDTTGYGVSGSLTWYGAEGFYLDGQAQVVWYDSNLDSATAGQRLVDGNNGVGYALGVEAGKRIMLDPSWSLTPQAQLAWSSVDFDAFTDAFGARVTPGTNDSLLGRLGLSLDHQTQWQDRTGRAGHTNLYGIANLYYDSGDGSSVDLAGTNLSSRDEQLWGGLGVGGTINWADDKFSVFGEALARTGLKDFGDSYALTGSLGFRAKW